MYNCSYLLSGETSPAVFDWSRRLELEMLPWEIRFHINRGQGEPVFGGRGVVRDDPSLPSH